MPSFNSADRPSDALSTSHGPLWLWGFAALVVGLSAAVVLGAWMATARGRGPVVVSEFPLATSDALTAPDPAAALQFAASEAAAEAGDAIAQYQVAYAYLEGTLVPADRNHGLDLLRRSAAQDYIPAIMDFAEKYGNEVAAGADPVDVFAALNRLIANPPDNNILGAAHEMYGRYLLEALPVADRDPAGAVDHFVASLSAGNLYAARRIGDAYRLGVGRPADAVVAYAYYKVAEPVMADPLGPVIFQLESSLTPDDLARAATLTLPVLLAQEPDLSH